MGTENNVDLENLFFINENNEVQVVGKISEVNISDDEDITAKYTVGTEKISGTFIAKKQHIARFFYGNNNWRKMHGLPMISYKRYPHEKRRRK